MKRRRSHSSAHGTTLQHWPRDLRIYHLWVLLQYDVAEALSSCFNLTENPRESYRWFVTTLSKVLGVVLSKHVDATRSNLEQVNQEVAAGSSEEQTCDGESGQIPKFEMNWTLRNQLSQILHEKVTTDGNFTFDLFITQANQILNGSLGEPHVEVNNLVQGPMFYGIVIKREIMRKFHV